MNTPAVSQKTSTTHGWKRIGNEASWNVMVKTGKPKNAKMKKGKQAKAEANVLEEEGTDVAAVDTSKGWERLDLTADSGAAETFCQAREAMSIATVPGFKFLQGVQYTCANGKKIPNLSEKRQMMCTDESAIEHNITMQVADANRPLM